MRKHILPASAALVSTLVLSYTAVIAQVSSEDYARAERLLGWNANKLVFNAPVNPEWLEDGRFWYRKRIPDGHEFIYVNPSANEQRPAFDHARLAAALSAASGHPYEASKLPFEEFEYLDEGNTIQFWEQLDPKTAAREAKKEREEEEGEQQEKREEGRGWDEGGERQEDLARNEGKEAQEAEKGNGPEHRRWRCNLTSYECVGPEDIAEDPVDEVESPDGRWVAFERDNNLWVRSAETDEEIQLSKGGEDHYGYAIDAEGCCYTVSRRRSGTDRRAIVFWSPDSTKIATYRLDERDVEQMHLIETHEGRPVLHSYRCALPGDEVVPLYKLHVFDVEARTQAEVDTEPIEQFWSERQVDVRWSEDSSLIFFLREHRGHQKMILYGANGRDRRSGRLDRGSQQHLSRHAWPARSRNRAPAARLAGHQQRARDHLVVRA